VRTDFWINEKKKLSMKLRGKLDVRKQVTDLDLSLTDPKLNNNRKL